MCVITTDTSLMPPFTLSKACYYDFEWGSNTRPFAPLVSTPMLCLVVVQSHSRLCLVGVMPIQNEHVSASCYMELTQKEAIWDSFYDLLMKQGVTGEVSNRTDMTCC